jgi:hypothetical protein
LATLLSHPGTLIVAASVAQTARNNCRINL